jgi:hypothetical protein
VSGHRHFNHFAGPRKPSRRCVGCGARSKGHVCGICLDRIPTELRQEWDRCERECAGGGQWLRALAAIENWGKCNPGPTLLTTESFRMGTRR